MINDPSSLETPSCRLQTLRNLTRKGSRRPCPQSRTVRSALSPSFWKDSRHRMIEFRSYQGIEFPVFHLMCFCKQIPLFWSYAVLGIKGNLPSIYKFEVTHKASMKAGWHRSWPRERRALFFIRQIFPKFISIYCSKQQQELGLSCTLDTWPDQAARIFQSILIFHIACDMSLGIYWGISSAVYRLFCSTRYHS